jgi:hypothetical protein
LAYIGIPCSPVTLGGSLGYNTFVEQLIAETFDTLNNSPLPYLARRFLAVKAGKVYGFKGNHLNPLPGITFGRGIGKVMAGGIKSLLVNMNTPLADFYSLKG